MLVTGVTGMLWSAVWPFLFVVGVLATDRLLLCVPPPRHPTPTGYIANHVYKQLLDAGYTVRGTSRSTTGVKIDALKALAPSGAKVEFVSLLHKHQRILPETNLSRVVPCCAVTTR